jgi:hypothetical protein
MLCLTCGWLFPLGYEYMNKKTMIVCSDLGCHSAIAYSWKRGFLFGNVGLRPLEHSRFVTSSILNELIKFFKLMRIYFFIEKSGFPPPGASSRTVTAENNKFLKNDISC